MESVCTQNVPGVRIPPSPPRLNFRAGFADHQRQTPGSRQRRPKDGGNPPLSATLKFRCGVSRLVRPPNRPTRPSISRTTPRRDSVLSRWQTIPTPPTSSSSGGSRRGDDQAFRDMVDRYNARVYSLSYGVLRNPEDAEEATQDTFLTLYRKIGTFDESKKFFSWFYRVALNSAYTRARRRKSAGSTVSLEDYMPRFGGDGQRALVGVRGLGRRHRGRGDRPRPGRARRGLHRRAVRRPTGTRSGWSTSKR